MATQKKEERGWGGREKYPNPDGVGFIECDEMKCVGCEICQMACSVQHFGVINKDLSRIQVRKYLIPIPKAVPTTCTQCQPEERECEKACPLDPPAIYLDRNTLHMVVDEERCLGQKCLLCKRACSSDSVRIYPSVSSKPFVCDLCDTNNKGNRSPQCVNVCPYNALAFKATVSQLGYAVTDSLRKHADEKAELIAKRLYPLTRQTMRNPGWK